MKKLFALLTCLFLLACSESDNYRYYTQEIKTFASPENFKDSIIYIKDSLDLVDIVEQSVSFDNYAGDDSNKPVTFEADGRTMAIDIFLSFKPTTDGGEIKVNCGYKNRTPIIFDNPKFPMKERGYVLEKMDSVKVNDSTYYDILVFDASKADTNNCNMEKFYYAAKDGIVKIVSKNGMELNRITLQKYESIEKENAAKRAREDSTAQALSDSIAKAVADSIAFADSLAAIMDSIKAATENAASDSLAKDIVDAIENFSNCIEKATSLSDFKNCVR